MDEEAEHIVEMTGSTSASNTTSAKPKRSETWKEFIKFGQGANVTAKCKYCPATYKADSNTGTTNMARHIGKCKKRPLDGDVEECQGSKKIDQAIYREKLAACVLRHGYAFMWAEHEGDRDCHSYLNDNAKFICRNTMKADCLKMHETKKGMVRSFLESLPGRVCLTTDLWTSCSTEGFICLTAHCIDSDWKLSSRILNFRHIHPPHSASALCDHIHGMLKDWGLEKKIFSITMDNAINMDNMQENLRCRLSNSLVCEGKFFHIRCCAHILNLIVQAGLKFIVDGVKNVRNSVKYVKGAEARKIKFRECVQLAGINSTKGLWLDVPTR